MSFKETPLYLYSKPDLILVVEDKDVEVHEFVLASQSEFFKTALSCGLKESCERRITLPEIRPAVLFTVLQWLYRGHLESPLHGSPSHSFSDESTKKLKDIMQAFDFLQIKGAGKDYCKFVEEALQKLGPHRDSFNYYDEVENHVIVLNEVYRSGGSITKEALDWLIEAVVYYKSSSGAFGRFMGAMESLEDPDGRCFRDMSTALGRKLFKVATEKDAANATINSLQNSKTNLEAERDRLKAQRR